LLTRLPLCSWTISTSVVSNAAKQKKRWTGSFLFAAKCSVGKKVQRAPVFKPRTKAEISRDSLTDRKTGMYETYYINSKITETFVFQVKTWFQNRRAKWRRTKDVGFFIISHLTMCVSMHDKKLKNRSVHAKLIKKLYTSFTE